ncbi:MAG: PLDc N-terminal domain-containing protein [Defluviitaleaceae bacterium]|nr:PLDc N-terminal domain-containing protein [Defluviitaleaceae bacterium]
MMDLSALLMLLAPLVIIQIALMVAAVVHILRHNHYKSGNRTLWLIIAICINIIGPILYFVIGKGDAE